MNKNYFFFLPILLFSISTAIAQTHTWTGNGNGVYWWDAANWDQGTVPLGNGIGTVIIPANQEVITDNVVNFEFGEITGGGTLINNGTFNMINADEVQTSKAFSNIDFINNGNITIYKASGINNNSPIILNENAYLFLGHTGLFTLNNIGITATTNIPGFMEIIGPFTKTGLEDVTIDVKTRVCCYIFEVNEGRLIVESKNNNLFQSPNLMVQPNASLILSGDTTFQSGASLEGSVLGYFEIRSNGNKHPTITSNYFFEFTGTVHFKDVTFRGGGTLHNRATIVIPENTTVVLENLKLSNQDLLEMNASSSIIIENSSRLGNTGYAELVINGGNIIGNNKQRFDNTGLITIADATDHQIENVAFSNYGNLDLGLGGFILDDTSSFVNQYYTQNDTVRGQVYGSGKFKFPDYSPVNVDNNGSFSPRPGIATLHTEKFSQDLYGITKIEINNLSDYDVISNTGASRFEGGFELTLNFAPAIGDEFTVFTSDEPISLCAPVLTVSANYNNANYTFDVICNPTNIVLKLATLNINDFDFTEAQLFVSPNPVKETAIIHFNLPKMMLSSSNNLSISIYNTLGQEIKRITDFSKENNSFERGNLSSGIYFLHLKNNGKLLATTKMVID